MFGRILDSLSNLRPRQLFLLAGASAIIIFALMYIGLKIITDNNVQVPMQMTKNEQAQETPQVVMKTVVVATRTIEPKSIIIASMLGTKEVPENSAPPDAVMDINEVISKPARSRIVKDEIITQQKFYKNIQQSGFVGTIPPDCRAVAVNLNDVTGVAGFAKPGDYVDVLLIERAEGMVTSRLILQNVLLMSINKSMTQPSAPQPQPQPAEGDKNNQQQQQQKPPVNPATQAIDHPALATLALRPDEVLQLVSASRIGEIYLMLRPLVPQSDYYNGAEYSIESLQAQLDRAAKEAAANAAREEREAAAAALAERKAMELEAEMLKAAMLAEAAKQAEEDADSQLSIKDVMRGKKAPEYSNSVSPENRIEIMYGNDQGAGQAGSRPANANANAENGSVNLPPTLADAILQQGANQPGLTPADAGTPVEILED